MKKRVEEYNIEYTVVGEENEQDMVIFHGWGCNKEMFEFVCEHFRDKYRIFAFDLPGFGGSKEPETVMGTYDYANYMKDVFNALGINKPVGLGHSFGGRILIQMVTEYTFEKLILTGSAGVVNKRPLSYYVKVYSYKGMKQLYRLKCFQKLFPDALEKYKRKAGSADYNQASPIMQKILSKVVNEDLVGIFKMNDAPTLLIWGELDTATPLNDAKIMEKKFPDAGLVVFEEGTHYAFLEQSQRFLKILDFFIG